jgi:hypothetical protein
MPHSYRPWIARFHRMVSTSIDLVFSNAESACYRVTLRKSNEGVLASDAVEALRVRADDGSCDSCWFLSLCRSVRASLFSIFCGLRVLSRRRVVRGMLGVRCKWRHALVWLSASGVRDTTTQLTT